MESRSNPLHGRFKDAPWYDKEGEPISVMIGGAGGIGSWTALLISRAGFEPIIYDFDYIEEHNLGGQIFPKRLIGDLKSDAISAVIKDFCGMEVLSYNEKIDENTPTHGFVISAFDNMAARKAMFESWVSVFGTMSEDFIFIDGRLQAEHMQILCVRGMDTKAIETYRKEYLFEDSDIEDAPCTMKQTSHAAAMIASHIVGFFTNHVTNLLEKDNTRAVPFFWEYFIPIDFLEIKNIEVLTDEPTNSDSESERLFF
jgi:hypothetical protein